MKNHITLLLFCLITCLATGQETKQDQAFKTIDNISLNKKTFTVKIYYDADHFVLKICKVRNCFQTGEFSHNIRPGTFSQEVVNFVSSEIDTTIVDTLLDPKERIYLEELQKIIKDYIKADRESKKSEAQKTTEAIDNAKNQYSGKLIIHKTVDYWITERQEHKYNKNKFIYNTEESTIPITTTNDDKVLELREQSSVQNKTISKQNNKSSTKEEGSSKKVERGLGSLEIINAKIKLFNNKATSIYIKAVLTEDGKDPETLIFLNNRFSIAIRYFNHYGNRVSAQTKNKEWVTIDYNDVFNYESDQYYNYSVANDQVSLSTISPDSMSVKIKQRRFFDYFTGIVYSDVLSFNTENSNSLLNAQAKLLLPLNLRNVGRLSFIRQFSASINVALSNSFSDETRYIAIKDNETFNHFDLLKKHNVNGKLDLQAINLEYKRLFMNIALGYSAAFYRSGFQYTQTSVNVADVVTNRQILSLGHGPFINFEIRPQSNFGADILMSFEDLNYNDTVSINGRNFKRDVINDRGHNHLGFKYNLFNVEANFYWLTSNDKTGGVYAKLGSYYHTESHEIFPQIMVGYATNLTSFVNRFKPKAN